MVGGAAIAVDVPSSSSDDDNGDDDDDDRVDSRCCCCCWSSVNTVALYFLRLFCTLIVVVAEVRMQTKDDPQKFD
jgi:hypothetical protein